MRTKNKRLAQLSELENNTSPSKPLLPLFTDASLDPSKFHRRYIKYPFKRRRFLISSGLESRLLLNPFN